MRAKLDSPRRRRAARRLRRRQVRAERVGLRDLLAYLRARWAR